MRLIKRHGGALIVLGGLCSSALSDEIHYHPQALDVDEVDHPVIAVFGQDLNVHGEVVGFWEAAPDPWTSFSLAWVWSAEDGFRELCFEEVPPYRAKATSINDDGYVVGFYRDLCVEGDLCEGETPCGPQNSDPSDVIVPVDGIPRMVVWPPHESEADCDFDVITGVGPLYEEHDVGAEPIRLSNDLQAVGVSLLTGGGGFGTPHGFLWSGGDCVEDLSSIAGTDNHVTSVNDISVHDAIVGSVNVDGYEGARGYYKGPDDRFIILPIPEDVGDPANVRSVAITINDHGAVGGRLSELDICEDGVCQPGEDLGGYVWHLRDGLTYHPAHRISDMNNAGAIVGSLVEAESPGQPAATVFIDDEWHVIDDHVNLRPGMVSQDAVRINEQGQILLRVLDHQAGPGEPVITTIVLTPVTPGDLNGNGTINVSDLLILVGQWGECPDDAACVSDLTGSGDVGVDDLLILLSNWKD